MRLQNSLDPKNRFSDELKFFKNWIHNPKSTGAVLPTGPILAKSMASFVNPSSAAPVLELGPGTGVITKAILETGLRPENLFCLEYSLEFVRQLRELFADVNIVPGNAFDLEASFPFEQTPKFSAVISALPLLNFKMEDRVQLLNDLFDRMEPDAPVVQFSYGAFSPIEKHPGQYSTEARDWILRNIPPARVWVYRRSARI